MKGKGEHAEVDWLDSNHLEKEVQSAKCRCYDGYCKLHTGGNS
jgi:hypothetical protein